MCDDSTPDDATPIGSISKPPAIWRGVHDGDAEALTWLVERHRAWLLDFADSWLGRPEDAEDAVQETFLWAIDNHARYDPTRGAPATWLLWRLRTQCDRMRKRKEVKTGPAVDHADEATAESRVRQLRGPIPIPDDVRHSLECVFKQIEMTIYERRRAKAKYGVIAAEVSRMFNCVYDADDARNTYHAARRKLNRWLLKVMKQSLTEEEFCVVREKWLSGHSWTEIAGLLIRNVAVLRHWSL